MAKTYDADEFTLETLLKDYADLRIPPFQRPFKWTNEELNDLFADIESVISASKDKSSKALSHFMGAMVFSKVSKSEGQGAEGGFYILDGQQRVTTLTLILCVVAKRMQLLASQEVLPKRQIDRSAFAAVHLNKLFSQPPGEDSEGVPVLSLQELDSNCYARIIRAAPESLVTGASSTAYSKRQIDKIYDQIVSKINSVVKNEQDDGKDPFTLLDAWAKCLSALLSIVVIVAEDESAAFRLFETLNARGLELSAADLIKNKLFAICSTDDQRTIVRDKWKTLLAFDAVDADVVGFLRTKWLSDSELKRKVKGEWKLNEFIRKDDLFDAFRDYLDQHKTERNLVGKFMEELVASAEMYEEIVSAQKRPDSDYFAEFRAINDLGAKTCRPLLLSLYKSNKSLISEVSKLIEPLIVRWMVSKQVANVLETTFASLAGYVSEMSPRIQSSEIYAHVKFELMKLDVPGDSAFRQSFSKWRPANTSRVARHILCRINESMSSTREIAAGTDDVHVEHIFPKSPSKAAYEESGIIEGDEAEELSQLIGNLTLLDASINKKIKNWKFSDKLAGRPDKALPVKGINASVLTINSELKLLHAWTKQEIESRSVRFADMAVRIWPWLGRT
jgi:uncharacterized protein with ParB-like and HNH nuclease domain